MSPRRRDKPAAEGYAPLSNRLFWLVVLITVFVFLPALSNEFVNWDDDVNFVENPHYRGLGVENFRWGATTFLLGHYHPLTWFSLGLDYAFWGASPVGHHLTNVLLHGFVAGLVFLLFQRLISLAGRTDSATAVWAAAIGALLFSLHPLRVESVAWASERRDVLSGLFVVGTLLLYARRKVGWALGAFCAALLSKVIAVTLPFVLLLIDLYPLQRKISAKLVWEKWPFALASAAAAWIALGRYESGVSGSVADLDLYPGLRIAFSVFSPAFYLLKTLAPWDLAPQYVWATTPSAFDTRLLAGGVFVVVLTAIALVWRRRYPWLGVAWASMLVTLLPVLSIVRLDRQQFVSDHHSYLATLGITALAAGGWMKLHKRSRSTALVVAFFVVLALSGLTVRQIGFWRDSKTLWTHTLRVSPLSVVGHNNLGRALAAEGDAAGAVTHFRRAAELSPRFAQAHYNLGSLLMRNRASDKALPSLMRAAEIQPANAQIRSDLGNCLLRLGKKERALRQYEIALDLDPEFNDARYNYALALELSGQIAEATEQYGQVAESQPENRDAWLALERLRSWREAGP